MSGPLALAGTSAVLRELLLNGLLDADAAGALGVATVEVTLLPPDLLQRTPPPDNPQLNLFLYNVVRNTGWAGQGLPARDAHGRRSANPVLALDLHYLLSAYGNREFEAEVLLGAAMKTLHETPGLDRTLIRAALPPAFGSSALADQFETLRIAPTSLSTEEIARLWSAFQTPFRPSVAFVVSVVLIESTRPGRTALPVRARVFVAQPMAALRIDRVLSGNGPGHLVTPLGRLRLEGRQLGNPDLRVWINSLDFSAGIVRREDRAVELDWPAALPAALRAGASGALAVQPAMLGLPPTPHEGFTSNVAGFVLCPAVQALSVPVAGTLRVGFVPPAGPAQRVQLMLNETGLPPGAAARSFTLMAPPSNGVIAPATEVSQIDFDAAAVPPGNWLVRLQVDGAASPLGVSAAGLYDAPQVVL